MDSEAELHLGSLIKVSALVLLALAAALAAPTGVAAYLGLDVSSLWKAQWGNAANVLGLLASIVGFAWTVILAREATSAARRAELAAEEAKRSVYRFDTVVELTEAMMVMQEIMRHHRDRQWASLPPRYSAIRTLLVRLKAPASKMNEEQKTRIGGVFVQLNEIDATIEGSLLGGKGSDPPKFRTWLDILKQQNDHLSETLAELRSAGS